MPGVSLGDVVGDCRIESVAGRGGMGVVYRAVQVRLDRPVAFKVISPELAADSVYRGRFQREARLTASIEHANVLPVYEAGELDGGELYLVMRWVGGTDLRQLLAREDRLPPGRAVELLAPVALGLDAAHARGLVHRDVKPANVLIAGGEDPSSEHVYLTDFGIARGPGEDRGLTVTGAFLGTLAYAAPERIDGHRAGPAADIYALGCVLFETLTGWLPFNRESELATMNAHLRDPIPTARSHTPDVPAKLDEVIRIALAKDPAQRFPSAAAMATALENALVGRSIARTITPDSQPPPAHHPGSQLDTTLKSYRDPAQAPAKQISPRRRSPVRWSRRRKRTALAALAAGALATLAITLASGGGQAPVAISFHTVYQLAAFQTVAGAVPNGSDVWFLTDNELVHVPPNALAAVIPLEHPSPYPTGDSGSEPLAVDPSGLMWVSGEHGWQVIDSSGSTVARFASPLDPSGGFQPAQWAHAFGGGYAWVGWFARGYKIHMIDLSTRRVVGRAIPTPADTLGLAYAPQGTLWRLTSHAVTAIRGPHAGFSQPIRIPADEPFSLAIDASGGLWIGTLQGLVLRLDAAGHPAGPPIDVGSGPTHVAAAGNAIWVLNPESDTLTSIRTVGAGRGAIEARVTIPGARLPGALTLSCIAHKCVITDLLGGADHHTSEVIEASF